LGAKAETSEKTTMIKLVTVNAEVGLELKGLELKGLGSIGRLELGWKVGLGCWLGWVEFEVGLKGLWWRWWRHFYFLVGRIGQRERKKKRRIIPVLLSAIVRFQGFPRYALQRRKTDCPCQYKASPTSHSPLFRPRTSPTNPIMHIPKMEPTKMMDLRTDPTLPPHLSSEYHTPLLMAEGDDGGGDDGRGDGVS
jgi:hypothetical protein